MKKLLLICLITFCFHSYSYAVVTIVDSESTNSDSKKPVVKPVKKSKKAGYKVKAKPRKIEQLHIDGYIGRQYVRLVVDIVDDKELTGYLFEHNGSKIYIYGEKIHGDLHLYDESGRYLNVVLSR